MVNVQLICVGKLKEAFFTAAAAEYQKRLGGYCKLQITEIPEEKLPPKPSPAQISAALSKEAAAIRAKLPQSHSLAALCIEGTPHSSEDVAELLRRWEQESSRSLVFLIGGSYGLDASLKEQARLRLSMSPMTFPHHLARVMLLEQLYRGFKINEASAYHK